ncbi:hypothetical protein ACFV1D_45960, partial [Streptomyces mirabilis]
MTPPATDRPVAPDWLAAAEAAHQEQQIYTVAQRLQRAERHAELINARLADLGIEPRGGARREHPRHPPAAPRTPPPSLTLP